VAASREYICDMRYSSNEKGREGDAKQRKDRRAGKTKSLILPLTRVKTEAAEK